MGDSEQAPGPPHFLGDSEESLVERHDLVMLDLDGVVYVGPAAVPHAADVVGELATRGVRCGFVTNNASRSPAAVASKLRELGVAADADDVVTSAQAAARMLVDLVGEGATVFVIGGEGLTTALEERGLHGTQQAGDDLSAVATGYHPDTRWRTVIDGALLVRDGMPWVATNTDMTVPTARGPAPGNGVLVRAIAQYAEVEPRVAGKPEPPLIQETVRRLGGERPLMVGDRLDTDIEGARRAGCDSLLVMTGVTALPELVAAAPEERPTYLGADLRALLAPHPAPAVRDGVAELGGWTVRVEAGRLRVAGDGHLDDWWRAVTACAWRHRDASGRAVDVSDVSPPP